MESKTIFKEIEADMKNFKALGEEWVELEDKSSCAKSRSYAKRIMKLLKTYIGTSMADEKLVKPALAPAPIVEPEPVVEEEVLEEVAEEVIEEVVEDEDDDAYFKAWDLKKD